MLPQFAQNLLEPETEGSAFSRRLRLTPLGLYSYLLLYSRASELFLGFRTLVKTSPQPTAPTAGTRAPAEPVANRILFLSCVPSLATAPPPPPHPRWRLPPQAVPPVLPPFRRTSALGSLQASTPVAAVTGKAVPAVPPPWGSATPLRLRLLNAHKTEKHERVDRGLRGQRGPQGGHPSALRWVRPGGFGLVHKNAAVTAGAAAPPSPNGSAARPGGGASER